MAFAPSVEPRVRFRKKEYVTMTGISILKAYPPELMDELGIKDDDGGQLVSWGAAGATTSSRPRLRLAPEAWTPDSC